MSDYKIIREIGRGGMGCVYEALDTSGQRVALKMMSAQAASRPEYKELFEREVQSLRTLSHPAVVQIVGKPFADAGGNLFLPMEFVDGQTISQIVQANGPFKEQEALIIFTKLLDAFSYIHGKGCIHRDVKPSNVMLRPDGSICVIDFGIAKDCKTSTGKTIGRIIGTDGYMSPEQANGYNIDIRTDIYSLGCLLHFMLTGTHAIAKQSNDYDTICAILDNKFPLVADSGISISSKTQNAILKAVNKNMTLRFQCAEDFEAALIGGMYKITVGRSNCDINLKREYVSGRHLDILWKPQDEQGTSYAITIQDHSTNGTGIAGRKIKNESYTFMTNMSITSLKQDSSMLPQVMVAGLEDCMLNWNEVLKVLSQKADVSVSPMYESEKTTVTEDRKTTDSIDKIAIGYAILSFLFPIVGWVLGYVWKSQTPAKAKKANRIAWYGFVWGLILNLILFFV